MKTKQISKMLAPLSGIMSFMFAMGVMTVPVSAQEINMANSAYEESVKTDYTTYINSTVEKNGFKVTINKLTAAKNRMNVTTTIEFPNKITDESLNNSIFMFTVKKSKLESDWGNRRIINDKTVEVNFDITGFEDLPLNADLRFDVIIPEYNLNAWVNVNADLSKNIDKIIEKDIDIYNDKAKITYNKVEADVLGTSVYFKEDEHSDDYDHENSYSDSDSKILIKCDGKLYECSDRNFNYYGEGRYGRYTCKELTYDDINNGKSITLIPVTCTLTNKEKEEIYDTMRYDSEYVPETFDNVTYKKDFKFNDGKDGEVSKVEREDDKVKLYINTDSENKSILMACSMRGWIESNKGNYYGDAEKSMYKDPDSNDGYIIEFSGVDKDANLHVYCNDDILGYSEKFEFGKDVKIK